MIIALSRTKWLRNRVPALVFSAKFVDYPRHERWFLVSIAGFFSQGALVSVGDLIGQLVPLVSGEGLAVAVVFLPLGLYFVERIFTGKSLRILPFVCVYLLIVTLMLLSLATHPEYAEVMWDEAWEGSMHAVLFTPLAPIVAFLIVTVAPSVEIILRGLLYAAYIMFVGNVYRLYQVSVQGSWSTLNSRGVEIETSYSLGFGYSVLFSVVAFMFMAFAGRHVFLHLAGAAAGVLMILTNGSRAPLGIAIAVLILFALYFWRRVFFGSPARAVVGGFLVVGLAAIVLNLQGLLLGLQSLLYSWGIESRSFDRLVAGTFTEDRARGILDQMSEDLIASGGMFGHGFFGDRHYIRSVFRWGYPHNIVNEFLITFGVLGGALVIVAILLLLIAGFIKARRTIYCDLVLFIFPMTLQLWVSLSYLLSIWFWTLLGACWIAIRDSKSPERPGSLSLPPTQATTSLPER